MSALDNPRIKITGLLMVRGPAVTRSTQACETGPVTHSTALPALSISRFSGRLAPAGPAVDRIGLRRALFLHHPRRYRQIRAPSMHRTAEFGAAAHWRHKVSNLHILLRHPWMDQRPNPASLKW